MSFYSNSLSSLLEQNSKFQKCQKNLFSNESYLHFKNQIEMKYIKQFWAWSKNNTLNTGI